MSNIVYLDDYRVRWRVCREMCIRCRAIYVAIVPDNCVPFRQCPRCGMMTVLEISLKKKDSMELTETQKTLVQREMNKVINRCLWKPSGDPGKSLLRRAAAAYLVLKSFDMDVDGEKDVMQILSESTPKNYLSE